MQLVQNWQQCWKWVSIQVGAFQIAAQGAVATGVALMPAEQRNAFIAAHAMQYVYFTIAVTFLQTFGRLVNQTPPADPGNGAKP